MIGTFKIISLKGEKTRNVTRHSEEILKCHLKGVFGLFFVCFALLFSSKLKVITDNSIFILLAKHITECIFISLKAGIRLKL